MSGTDTALPSSSTTVSEWPEHETSTATASLLSTKVLIPSLQEEISILQYKPSNERQLVASKTAVRCQRYGIEPKFRIAPRVRDVDVWWLTILQTVEEEPEATDPQQRWHSNSLLPSTGFQKLRHLRQVWLTLG